MVNITVNKTVNITVNIMVNVYCITQHINIIKNVFSYYSNKYGKIAK